MVEPHFQGKALAWQHVPSTSVERICPIPARINVYTLLLVGGSPAKRQGTLHPGRPHDPSEASVTHLPLSLVATLLNESLRWTTYKQ